MKTSQDPRHEKRISTVHKLFAYSFDVTQREGIEEILAHIDEIDRKIATFATERPLHEINKLDLAILRLGVFELMYQDQSKAVVIDEAIEIAKSYGGDTSPKFVNAILGKIAQETK